MRIFPVHDFTAGLSKPARSAELPVRSMPRDQACQNISVHPWFDVMHVLAMSSAH